MDAKLHLIVLSRDYALDTISTLYKIGFYTQAILLTLTYLGLGGVSMGGFDNMRLNKLVDAEEGFDAKYIIPIGWPRYEIWG